MSSKRLGWLLGSSLLFSLAACDVSLGKCDEDAGCFDDDDWFDESDAGEMDGGGKADSGNQGDSGNDEQDGGTSSDAGPDAGDPHSGQSLLLSELCSALNSRWTAWSDALSNCCTADEFSSADVDSILKLFGGESVADGCYTSNTALIDSGKVTYHESYAGDCVAEYLANLVAPPDTCPGVNAWMMAANVGHGLPLPQQLASCRAAIAGTVPADGECSSDFECKDRLACKPGTGGGSGVTKRCLAPSKDGGTCTVGKDGECAPGLTCLGQPNGGDAPTMGVCRASLNETSCGRTKECVNGKFCDTADYTCKVAPAGDLICKN